MGDKIISEKTSLPISLNPQGESRPWIKLWVGPWLDGTTRYEMSGSQRAFWVDLLAQAARSRFPGIICPGQVNDRRLGYPLAWFSALQPDIDVWATLQLFQSNGKIDVTVTCEEPKCVAVEISNWSKYQPPLNGTERSRKSREKRKKSVEQRSMQQKCDAGATQCGALEGEVEGDKEGDEEKRRRTAAFASMNWEPYGSRAFQDIWEQEQRSDSPGTFADAMERCIQRCMSEKIKVPGRFFTNKRAIEKVEATANYRRTPL